MANEILWTAATEQLDSSNPYISNQTINDGAGYLSTNAIDNATNEARWGAFCLYTNLAATGVNGVFELYLIYSLDGTNYAIGDGTTKPPATSLAATFAPQDSSSANQYIDTIKPILLLPKKFKLCLWNESGVNTDASVTDVRAYTFSEEVQ